MAMSELEATLLKLYVQGRVDEIVSLSREVGGPALTAYSLGILTAARSEQLLARVCKSNLSMESELKRLASSLHQMLVSKELEREKFKDALRLERFGYSIGSQNDEDGIVREILRRLGIERGTFYEFGVGAGLQNCTVFLLLAGWRGVWVEIDKRKYEFIGRQFRQYISEGRLTTYDQAITPENVDSFPTLAGFKDIDVMSIDIDGNDYYIFKHMTLRPKLLIMEFNGLYPPPFRIIQEYDPDYVYSAHTYIGASLQSLVDLAVGIGYRLVGTNLNGLNAFFVREDLWSLEVFPVDDPQYLYNPPRHQLAWGGVFMNGPQLAIGSVQSDQSSL